MTLAVISVGFGRTGTLSLKLALEELGFGPCHHMKEVADHAATQVPLWNAALAGNADFEAIYDGYASAVDWPTAALWRELAAACPDAKFILSTRSPESWYASFSQTILQALLARDTWPDAMRPWFEMSEQAVIGRSLQGVIDKDGAIAAFKAHEVAVKATIPAERLLVHQAKDGWASLCAFLGVTAPSTPYPRTNSKEEFFALIHNAEAR